MRQKGRGVSAQLNSSSNSAVTQPAGEARNVRRTQQIKALHLQFEDLKKKIKDVESKNQKIIENIHKQYDFKKKPQTMEYMVDPLANPIIYYEQPPDKSPLSADNKSNQSDQSECEFKQARPPIKKNSNIKKNTQPAFHQSIEYRKTENVQQDREDSESGSIKTNNPQNRQSVIPSNNQFAFSGGSQFSIPNVPPQEQFQVSAFSGVNPFQQMSMQFPTYPSVPNIPNMGLSQVGSFYGQQNSYQFQQVVRREKQKIRILQKQLLDREEDCAAYRKLQKKFNSISTNHQQLVEGFLDQFMEEVIKKKMNQIEKYVKKNENKLKRLLLKINDKEQQYRSRRNIQEHRLRRSHSRSKRQISPKQNNYNSINSIPKIPMRKSTSQSGANQVQSASKSKQSEQSKSSQQFQQIASQYQEMIKIKNTDLETLELKLKQKDKELLQMTVKCNKLQTKVADFAVIPKANKVRRNSEKQQNLLANLDFDSQKETQIQSLNQKISEQQNLMNAKILQLRDKDTLIEKINKKVLQLQTKNKKLQLQILKVKQDSKRYQGSFKQQNQSTIKLKRIQNQLQLREKQNKETRQKCSKMESEKIQKQCQNFTLNNKIKKVESMLTMKQQKIQQLQKIIQSNTGLQINDFLQKSMYLQKLDSNQFQKMQQDKQKLQDDLMKQREQIFALQKNNEAIQNRFCQLKNQHQQLLKEHQTLLIQNQSMKINLKAIQFQKYSKLQTCSPLQKLLNQEDCHSEDQDTSLRDQLQQIKIKYEENQKILKAQKHQNLEFNTKVIKLNSQLNYFRELLSEREMKYESLRRQFEQNKIASNQLQQVIQEKDNELQQQKKINNEKIKEIESQWLDFEQEMRNKQDQNIDESHNLSDLRNSRNISEESFVNNYRNTFNSVNAQNQHLTQKLKEAQKIIQIQRDMQEKIIAQYRTNVDKIKMELRQKNKQNDQLNEEVQSLKRKIRMLQQTENRLKQMAKNNNEEEQLLGAPSQRLIELQMQLTETRQINNKLAAVQQQLFKQIAEKEQEHDSLIRLIHNKESKIQQLQDIIELKGMNFSSHISTSQHQSKIRDSMHSQSSLRYSMLSNNPNKDKTVELDLSQAGESFFQNNQSMISNVSEVFGRDQFPYQKMQLKRVEQRRLFQKTAAYIKSLKTAIEQKNKRIKSLQKKIQSLRNSELIRKDIYQIKDDFQVDGEDVFKDYLSVQLDNTHSQRHRYKQLQHETKLTIEQNNLLNNQIESMQDQLLKAQQQQASLLKVKDLYKDQIKSLIKKNQEQQKNHQEQIKKQRTIVEQSESVQKMQAIKQLFTKIMATVTALQNQGPKSKKRDERRKQLGDFVKVFCNLMNMQSAVREKMINDLKQNKK